MKNSAIDAAVRPHGGPRSAGNWSAADDEKVTAHGPLINLKKPGDVVKKSQGMSFGGGRGNRSRADRRRSGSVARGCMFLVCQKKTYTDHGNQSISFKTKRASHGPADCTGQKKPATGAGQMR